LTAVLTVFFFCLWSLISPLMYGTFGSILVYFHFVPSFGQTCHFVDMVSDLLLKFSNWILVASSKLNVWDGL
jgi:hypothetical protein